MKQTTIKLNDDLWELLHINAIKLRLSFNDYVINIIMKGMEK
jgi:hypothetical protein